MMLFCSTGPNFWKMLCIFASLLFKKLTLSEVLLKILNKVLWLLFWVAASNVIKRTRWCCEISYQCNIKTVKLLKLKKNEQTERLKIKVQQYIYFRHFGSFGSLFLIVSMSTRFSNIFQTARKNNLVGCNISFSHFVQVLFIYFHYKLL